ncbi:hypothetical protein [Streptosporangium sp. OZ121]|uniref:hypothetical protein n=1 Tax=Streptosporangium sp. OZ121 TaxID=3444183 RepID=UPI003F79AC08
MAVLTVNAADLSKALSNAEGWFPARGPVPVALVTSNPLAGLVVTVTDHYTAGEATCPAQDYTGPHVAVEISRADLVGLAARARKDGTRKVLSRVTVEPDGVIVHGSIEDNNAETATALAVVSDDGFRSEWRLLADMFAGAVKNARPFPESVMVSPGYLALFNKVRPDVPGRGVALLTCPPVGAVFGKVGPHFRGLVMVLDAERNEEFAGQGGLW